MKKWADAAGPMSRWLAGVHADQQSGGSERQRRSTQDAQKKQTNTKNGRTGNTKGWIAFMQCLLAIQSTETFTWLFLFHFIGYIDRSFHARPGSQKSRNKAHVHNNLVTIQRQKVRWIVVLLFLFNKAVFRWWYQSLSTTTNNFIPCTEYTKMCKLLHDLQNVNNTHMVRYLQLITAAMWASCGVLHTNYSCCS